MKWIKPAALLAILAFTGYAYADTIVAGSVTDRNLSGGLCSSAATSSNAVSLNCGAGGSSDGLAQVSATVDPLSVSMLVFLSSSGNPMTPGTTTLALANLSWN